MSRAGGRKLHTDWPQLVAKLNAASATKNWKQSESKIQTVIKIYGVSTGHRNSYRYDFEAMSKVFVADCDRHIYVSVHKRLRDQDQLPRFSACQYYGISLHTRNAPMQPVFRGRSQYTHLRSTLCRNSRNMVHYIRVWDMSNVNNVALGACEN